MLKVSIVTVSFNSAKTIKDTLHSVARQDYKNIEHIIIDGASTDPTIDIVNREGKHVATVLSEPDSGIFDAMNKGLNLATGDVIGFLNSDDMLAHTSSIAEIVKCFQNKPVDCVYGDIILVDPVNVSRIVRYWRPGPHVTGACAKGWMAPHPTFYVRRDALVRIGGFNTEYSLQSDFDLMIRLFEQERIFSTYLPQSLVIMRMGGATTGSIRNIIRGNVEASRAVRAAGFSGGIPFVARKLLRKLPQFIIRPSTKKIGGHSA